MIQWSRDCGLRKGFTLIELLLVLVILGAMMAVTLPYVTRSHDGLKLEQEVRNLADAIRYGTQLAESANRPIRILLDTTSGCYSLEIDATNADDYAPIDDPIGALRRLDPKVKIAHVTGFESDGKSLHYLSLDPRRPWPQATLELTAGDLTRRIRVAGKLVEVDDGAAQ